MVPALFRISVSLGLFGMCFGLFMGLTHNFELAAAHAHLNLLGFVVMFLAALYYRVVPEAAKSRLAPFHAGVSAFGAVFFPIGIACVTIGGHERYQRVVDAGGATVIVGMALFAVIVYRTAGYAGRPLGDTR